MADKVDIKVEKISKTAEQLEKTSDKVLGKGEKVIVSGDIIREPAQSVSLGDKLISSSMYEEKVRELAAVQQTLKEKGTELAKAQAMLATERLEATEKQKAFENELKQYQGINAELENLRKKMAASYSTEDISKYLNRLIKQFNDSTDSDNTHASYVISNMDVDLKVRIYGDEKNDLRFTAPSITETTEDSLSSIKISIQAVPK